MKDLLVTAGAFWLLLTSAGFAWNFSPGTPCLLTHEAEKVSVKLTFDVTVPLYTISITKQVPFTAAPVFSMQFIGPAPLGISTDQHQLSNGNRTLSVTDSGFGNVLNGLQFNEIAKATLGEQSVAVSLKDAADAVAAFRDCGTIPTV